MTPQGPLELLRPFLWIAIIAFLTGFSAYALVGASTIAQSFSPS